MEVEEASNCAAVIAPAACAEERKTAFVGSKPDRSTRGDGCGAGRLELDASAEAFAVPVCLLNRSFASLLSLACFALPFFNFRSQAPARLSAAAAAALRAVVISCSVRG